MGTHTKHSHTTHILAAVAALILDGWMMYFLLSDPLSWPLTGVMKILLLLLVGSGIGLVVVISSETAALNKASARKPSNGQPDALTRARAIVASTQFLVSTKDTIPAVLCVTEMAIRQNLERVQVLVGHDHPLTYSVAAMLGRVLMRQSMYAETAELYREFVAGAPREMLYDLACCECMLGDYHKARGMLRMHFALGYDPKLETAIHDERLITLRDELPQLRADGKAGHEFLTRKD